MNSFDTEILKFFNRLAHENWQFDTIMGFFAGSNLLKGTVYVLILWWVWFRKDELQPLNRGRVIVTALSSMVAISLARGMALLFPFRDRPLHNESLDLVAPFGLTGDVLQKWSSFPSDHAALVFALAVGLVFINRKAGIIALLYGTVLIALPRVYLGLHYPTDVIMGAILGIAIAIPANIFLARNRLTQAIVDLSYTRPGLFYPIFFLFSYQIADMFVSSRDLVDGVYILIKGSLVRVES